MERPELNDTSRFQQLYARRVAARAPADASACAAPEAILAVVLREGPEDERLATLRGPLPNDLEPGRAQRVDDGLPPRQLAVNAVHQPPARGGAHGTGGTPRMASGVRSGRAYGDEFDGTIGGDMVVIT